MVVAGSAYVLGDLAGRTAQLGPAAWVEFDGPILLAMLVVNAGVLTTITLVVLRRARRRPQSATNLDHLGGDPPTMLDKLEMASQVIMRPNSAFATLRDDDHLYFRPSIVVLLLTSIVGAGLGSTMPAITGQPTMNAVVVFGLTVLWVVANACTVYLIGRALGGNKSWRKVLTVLFYMSIIWIPVATASSTSSLLPFDLQGVAFVMVVAILTWAIIINVKAVKVLNGFGTAKAFGILILSEIVQMAWIIPVVLLYLWTIRFELMQATLQ